MGWQIIKQPNGKYCIFSSIVDNIIYYDGTREQIVNAFIDQEKQRIGRQLDEIFSDLEFGEKPYLQFTKTFDEMIETIETHHGKEEADKIKTQLT